MLLSSTFTCLSNCAGLSYSYKKMEQNRFWSAPFVFAFCLIFSTPGGTRTRMILLSQAPEACVSTNFTTSVCFQRRRSFSKPFGNPEAPSPAKPTAIQCRVIAKKETRIMYLVSESCRASFPIPQRRKWDSNPRTTYMISGFQDRCNQPGYATSPYSSGHLPTEVAQYLLQEIFVFSDSRWHCNAVVVKKISLTICASLSPLDTRGFEPGIIQCF